MNLLDLLSGEYRKSGNKNGGEYSGACPWCGDGGKGRGSDRFRVWPEQGRGGSYWCRMCGQSGDAIRYLMQRQGLQFKAALDRLNLRPEDVLGPKTDKIPAGWQPSAAAKPAEVWADHARKFTDWCHARLLERPKELAWLADRGIGEVMVKKYLLGWNPDHAWREGSAWGVTMGKKPDGKSKKLWLPRGLVIPMIDQTGRVLRLRIRQPDQLPRYMVITGSSREPLCSREAEAMIVVESELDAILLDGLAGDLVGVVAMGNDTAKPTATLLPILESALTILVSLDSDLPRFNAETGNMDMPGAKASRWWLKQFHQAFRVPVVGGKDPGDAYRDGENLRTWVLAALPPYFHVKAELEEERTRQKERRRAAILLEKDMAEAAAMRSPAGEEQAPPSPAAAVVDGDQCQPVPVSADHCGSDQPETTVKTVTLKDGRRFCITPDREVWDRLTAAGEIVFSEFELKRLQEACTTMSAEERAAAAMLVLDFKEVFSPAYIRRGEAITG